MSNTTNQRVCPIWPGQITPDCSFEVPSDVEGYGFCPRMGGGYSVTQQAVKLLKDLDDTTRTRLATIMVGRRIAGDTSPLVTEDDVKRSSINAPLSMPKRLERLLEFLVSISNAAGIYCDLTKPYNKEAFTGKYVLTSEHMFFLMATAWTESIQYEETEFFVEQLVGMNLIEKHDRYMREVRVTIEGYKYIQERRNTVNTSQCFIAMWFDDSMIMAFDVGIEPAVIECGYRPMRIDRKPDVQKIDDEIIAEIRRSRFMIADFTYGDYGARGGVYYEAGFAHGLSIPVIYSCRADLMDELHFDTRQIYHVVWSNPEELRIGLKQRIGALIGDGPLL